MREQELTPEMAAEDRLIREAADVPFSAASMLQVMGRLATLYHPSRAHRAYEQTQWQE